MKRGKHRGRTTRLLFTPTHTFPGNHSPLPLSDLCCWSPAQHLLLFHCSDFLVLLIYLLLSQISAEELFNLQLFTPCFALHILSSILQVFLELQEIIFCSGDKKIFKIFQAITLHNASN